MVLYLSGLRCIGKDNERDAFLHAEWVGGWVRIVELVCGISAEQQLILATYCCLRMRFCIKPRVHGTQA